MPLLKSTENCMRFSSLMEDILRCTNKEPSLLNSVINVCVGRKYWHVNRVSAP